jgi:phosphohistidine swiveling domain-containing protein
MVAPIALADKAAQDPAVTGVKAARLAAAAGAGLPVLAGRVLPVEGSAEAIARGVEELEVGSGAPAAYLAAMESMVPADLPEDIAPRSASVDQLLVVRSSTLLDDDGRWSGTFTSYTEVGSRDLATAVRGCWASAFSIDALERCRETGIEAGSLRIGVLVQPFLSFDAGGTSRVRRDGTVIVTAAQGGPGGVVGGRGGGPDVVVGADGRVVDGLDDPAVGTALVEAAAALARRADEAVAACVIEWGAIGDELYLLQIGPTPPEAAAVAGLPRPTRTPVSIPAGAERLAWLVTAFPGPLGDQLVFPWALGAGEVPEAEQVGVEDPAWAIHEARALSGDLAARVWGTSPDVARERAAAVSRLLLQGRVAEGCREIRDLPAPDMAAARRVVGLVRGVAAFLAEAGFLPSPLLVWRLTASELERAIAGERPSLRRGPGRWEPFVADVVRARGVHTTGRPVSPGIAAGQLHPLRELRAMGRPGLRDVLVTPLPLPHLAPLLWHSAAIVSIGGSSGAHLFEVARSLGVPAVIGVEAAVSGGAGSLVAVDGDTGVVSVLLPDATAPVPSSEDIRAMV